MEKQRYTNLDAFRGLAALLVLLFHSPFFYGYKTTFISNSDIFVDFFFILSGFVIAHAYKSKIDSLNFKTYMQNRFARIYPLHLTLLLAWLMFLSLKHLLYTQFNLGNTDPFINNDFTSFILNLLLLNAHNLDDQLTWNAPSWSIGAEFYTYLLFFVVAKSIRVKNLLQWSIFLIVLAYTTLYILKPITLLRTFDLGFIRAIGGFFLGVSVFIIKEKTELNYSSKLKVAIIEVVLLLAVISCITILAKYKLGQLTTFLVFTLSIYYFSASNGVISTLLKTKTMQYLGKISYSIYLTHFLVINIIINIWQYFFAKKGLPINTPLADIYNTSAAPFLNTAIILITCLISAITYKFIEQPFQQKLSAKRVVK
ncbi:MULTISPECIES: acyltransferase [unclassified Pseudoalteromonas]|uniref:acyltransferase family protein n=1 Tax=unclassified Pseudoalteromonas TaxID=194690 RepID=UPI0015BA1489|nr:MULTISPECIES: acyltransferase [unclassified Pseudoalteromonas]